MGQQIRVWFGENFRSIARLLPGLKESSDRHGSAHGRIWTLVTSKNPSHAGRGLADAFEREPEGVSGAAYGRWVLEMVRRHKIDIVVPGRHRLEVARVADRIEALPWGPKVLATSADRSVLAAFDDKQRTFSEFAKRGLGDLVAPWRLARNAGEMRSAFAALDAMGVRRVCMKPARGIYGKGFRFVWGGKARWAGRSLSTTPPHGLTRAQALRLSNAETKHPRLLVMPLLAGPELSVDCYARAGRLVASLVRVKRGRTQRSETRPEAKQACERIAKAFGLNGFFNVQFRHEQGTGRLRLLEVNPRLAGGTSYGQASGFDLVYWGASHAAGLAREEDFPGIVEGLVLKVDPSRSGLGVPGGPVPEGES